MTDEIFRFVTVRPPRQTDSTAASTSFVDLGLAKTSLASTLRDTRPNATRDAMTAIAGKFIGSPDFIGSSATIDPKLLAFIFALLRLSDGDFGKAAGQAFSASFDTTPAKFVATPAFSTANACIADSIVASAIVGGTSPKLRSLLVRAARSLWVIGRLAANDTVSRREFLRIPILMPEGIFPLPLTGADLSAQRQAQAAADQGYRDARQKQLAQLTSELQANRTAINELLGTFERTGAQQPSSTAVAATTAASQNPRAVVGFQLPDASAAVLTATTKGALQKINVATTQIDVAKSVTLLEKASAQIAVQLYIARRPTGAMVRIGNRIFPKGALVGANTPVIDPGPVSDRSPGPCPPVPGATPPSGSASVPTVMARPASWASRTSWSSSSNCCVISLGKSPMSKMS